MNLRYSQSLVLLVAVLMGGVALPGCGGCWGAKTTADAKKQEEEEKEKQRKRKRLEKPKDDFEPLLVRMLPSNDPTSSLKTPQPLVKPGHWVSVQQIIKANNFDFPGELATFVEQTATNQPMEVEDTTARIWSACPAILPKGQTKRIESLFYVPRPPSELQRIFSIRSELRNARGGRTEAFNTVTSMPLKDYEHLIVVLAGNSVTPAAYSHFDRLLSVNASEKIEVFENEWLRHYHVIRPAADRSVPLPSYPLAWTTIAYVFWDDIDPAVLTHLQQQALLDWIHWGGQLVISGPSSLDKLKGSFLGAYLPAEGGETVKLEQADFDKLNATFSLPRRKTAASSAAATGDHLRKITVLPDRPVLGIELDMHSEGREMEGTGRLVVERRAGAGRIVVTRFPLTDVRIKQWKNFDGFFNAVLLRRPPREFSQGELSLKVAWAPDALRHMLLEARLGSTLRYFSRDVGSLPQAEPTTERLAATNAAPLEPAPPRRQSGGISGTPVYGAPGFRMNPFGVPERTYHRVDTSQEPGNDDWHFCGYQSSLESGVAAWNDKGAASEAARQALTEAAGIQIPKRDFVMQVLAVYLLVLVPLNWLVFWAIGRVEWAWVAAPIIAIVGAGAIIRLAQLDIGFARSRTEIAIVELQGGYERAHLTRYTALYSSLSSSYTLAFDESSSVALPLSSGPRNDSLLAIADYTDVTYRRDKETSLAGVQVSSNSTGMVHSEQMLPLGKNPKVTESLIFVGDEQKGYSIRNTTDIALRDVGVFRRVDAPSDIESPTIVRIEAAYLPKIDPVTSVPIRFLALTAQVMADNSQYPTIWLPDWDKTQAFAPGDASSTDADKGRVRLTRLARLAAEQLRLLPGDVRLVGWTDEPLPGMRINPEAPQNATYTLVLAHLARGPLPPVKPDVNVAEDYVDPTILESSSEPVEATEGNQLTPDS